MSPRVSLVRNHRSSGSLSIGCARPANDHRLIRVRLDGKPVSTPPPRPRMPAHLPSTTPSRTWTHTPPDKSATPSPIGNGVCKRRDILCQVRMRARPQDWGDLGKNPRSIPGGRPRSALGSRAASPTWIVARRFVFEAILPGKGPCKSRSAFGWGRKSFAYRTNDEPRKTGE